MKPGPRLALAALGVAALAGAAAAQDADTDGASAAIDGDWSFQTAVYEGGCQMSGSMTIASGAVAGIYEGVLYTLERCEHYPEDFPGFRTEQRVRLSRQGADVAIKATIVSVDPDLGNYWPDDFVVTVKHSALMEGELRSADVAPVRFTRGDAATS